MRLRIKCAMTWILLDHLVTEILVTAKSTAELLQGSDSQSFPPQWGRMSFCDRRGAVFSLRKKTVPHLAPHFKLGKALQFWEKVTCVAPSPFGEEYWKTKSIKKSFVLDYCSTLRSRSFHLLTQINIHFAPCYFGVPSLRLVSPLSRNVTFSHLSFGRVQNPLRPVWISKLPTV